MRTIRLSQYGQPIIYLPIRVIYYAQISLLKSFCSYISIQQNIKRPPEGKNQNNVLKIISRLKREMLFLIIDSESTHKITITWKFS